MIKEEMYNGELVRESPVPQTVLPRDLTSRTVAEGWQQVGKNIDQAFFTGVQMEDARKEFEASQLMDEIEDDVKIKVEAGLAAKDGDDGSFFDKTKTLRQGKLDNIRNEVQKAMAGVGTMIVDPNVRNRVQARAANTVRRMLAGLDETWQRVNREKTEQAWRDAYDLAVAKGNYDDAKEMLGRGVELNLFSPERAEVKSLELEKRRLREVAASAEAGLPAVVNVGGREYSGLSAALAMEAAREGTLEMDEGLPNEEMSPFDAKKVVSKMPEREFNAASDAFSFDSRVLTLPRVDGGVEVRCDVNAPECVQRVALHGNAHGGVDADLARMMVARISLDMVADNPGVTATQVTDVFAKAGIYEALGDGDAAVGLERARAIAVECLERGRGDSGKLGMGAIEPMIKAHLASPKFAASREWGRVASFDPRLNTGEVWDKSDLDEAGRKRWFGLYDVYRKYRHEFMPDAKGELDKDEFEENAQAFHAWYMKEKYKPLKEADEAAARDWYLMRTATDLRQKVYADAEGYAGYAGYGHDVQVAREVLRSMPPERLGADELVAASVASLKQDALRSEAFRKAAAADYERLRGLKQSEAVNSEAALRVQERKAKEEERKAERAAREAEKKAAQMEARKLFVARSTPREAAWAWDGKNAGDGTMAQCRIPESEYKRLQEELGFDGSQLVYVQVNGARVLVTGVSRSGKLELNAPAVAKVQKKPNTRKGERWKTSGSLGYSYYFKSAEAK